MRHELDPSVITLGDYLDDFTDFLALFAGWGVVVIIGVCLIVMTMRLYVLQTRSTKVQRVTTELFVAFSMLIGRNIAAAYVFHRPDLPQPYRVAFWLIVFVLCFRFFYFALWRLWVRPTVYGFWRFVIKPRLRETLTILVAVLVLAVASYLVYEALADSGDMPAIETPNGSPIAPPATRVSCSLVLHRCEDGRPFGAQPTAPAAAFEPTYSAAPVGYIADHKHMLLRWYYPTEVPPADLENERSRN